MSPYSALTKKKFKISHDKNSQVKKVKFKLYNQIENIISENSQVPV